MPSETRQAQDVAWGSPPASPTNSSEATSILASRERQDACDLFDIDARTEGDVTPAEFNAMLRQLLTEGFGLETHGPGTLDD